MEVRIHLPRPWITLTIAAVGILVWTGVIKIDLSAMRNVNPSGGQRASAVIADATQDINRERVKQAVLERQEEILRYQFEVLEREANSSNDPELIKRTNDARAVLLSIIKQRTTSEKLLTLSLEQLWEAEGTSFTLQGIETQTVLLWPIAPRHGISAHFEDAEYVKRFGFPHHAIDIPTPHGTPIQAPADGTVLKVALNGLGYSYVVLQHANGVQTVYGHISGALMKEGDHVSAGDEFALTGGTPGMEGTGLYSTGPHLHFAVRINGVLVDPLKYLPKL